MYEMDDSVYGILTIRGTIPHYHVQAQVTQMRHRTFQTIHCTYGDAKDIKTQMSEYPVDFDFTVTVAL